MKTFLSIAAVLLLLTSCAPETIEDIQAQDQAKKELELIDIYAREGEPDEDGTIDDTDPDDDGEG